MTHTYNVTGMSCSHCEARVEKALRSHPEITDVKVSRDANEAIVTMKHHVPTEELQKLVSSSGGYTLSDKA